MFIIYGHEPHLPDLKFARVFLYGFRDILGGRGAMPYLHATQVLTENPISKNIFELIALQAKIVEKAITNFLD